MAEQLNKPDGPLFDAPIPGMSLTHELGARPWQSPPRITTVEDTVNYYIQKLNDDAVAIQLLSVLEAKEFSVADLAHVIQMSSIMEGVHTIDVGILVTPIIMEFIMFMADAKGIDYLTGLEDDGQELSQAAINTALTKFRKESEANANASDDEEPAKEEPTEEPTGGLMSRRT
jgi:hypothetical protein